MINCKRVTIFVAIIALFFSCSNEKPVVPIFSVDITADSFAAEGGSKTITLASNVSWSASSNQDWLSVVPANGTGRTTITLTAAENNTVAARTAVVTITPQTGDAIKINISQATNYQFHVDLKEISFEAEQEEAMVALTSKTTWQVASNADWLTVSPQNGIGDATLILTASQNEAPDERSTVVTITPGTGDAIEISISQKAAPIPSSDVIKYVAPNSLGNGSGGSEADAADFLDDTFWAGVNSDLNTNSVEVKFLAGTYSRAFTEKSLILKNMGDPDNRLLLSGNENVRFTAPGGYPDKTQMIRVEGCQNLVISNFHFTGDGRIGYVLRVITTASSTMPNKNIVIEDCTWKHMNGVIYGATGCYGTETSHVTYKNCEFARVGIDSHSHHMYHAHGPSHIKIIDCHFEDCTGDYVRFRDRCDYNLVNNCTFVRNQGYRNTPFIGIPLFNNVNPGDEFFATNYSFSGNQFNNKNTQRTTNAINFLHWGFSPKEYKYLLTEDEGEILTGGSVEERTNLLNNNFGLDMTKIRIANNSYAGVTNNVALVSEARYEATSLGWEGTVNITNLPNSSSTPFDWEGE